MARAACARTGTCYGYLEDGHLVVVTADQHTGYGVNTCVNAVVDGYLVDPTTPLADEIICD